MIYRTQRKYFLLIWYQVCYYNRGTLTLHRIHGILTSKEAVPWFKRLVADLWKLKPTFGSKTILHGYVMDKMWHYNCCFVSVYQFYAFKRLANKLFTGLHLMSLNQNPSKTNALSEIKMHWIQKCYKLVLIGR